MLEELIELKGLESEPTYTNEYKIYDKAGKYLLLVNGTLAEKLPKVILTQEDA